MAVGTMAVTLMTVGGGASPDGVMPVALSLWMFSCVAFALLGWLVGFGTRKLYEREQRRWVHVAQVSRIGLTWDGLDDDEEDDGNDEREDAGAGRGDPREEVLAERVIEDPREVEAFTRMLQATRAAGLTPNLVLAQARRIVLHDIRANGPL